MNRRNLYFNIQNLPLYTKYPIQEHTVIQLNGTLISTTFNNQMTLRSCEHKAISPKSATLNFCEVLNFGQHHIGTFFKRSTYLPQYTYKVYQNQNQVKFRSVQTLLRITHLAHRKSYLVIICPNSHEKLTKSEIRSSSSRFEHCSESLIQPIGSHIWSLFVPIHMKS